MTVRAEDGGWGGGGAPGGPSGEPAPPTTSELVAALDAGRLGLVFQPIIALSTRRPVGAEALLRWHRGEQTLVPPAFWHLVDTALARRIGAYVLDAACRHVARWRGAGGCMAVSVNVDPRELSRSWVDGVRHTLERHRVPPAALTLELTETARVGGDRAAACVGAVRAMGVGVALDDTGTGYNALAAVTQVPLTELKIDRHFVARLGDARNDAVVRGLIRVAHDLDQRVVAEGVETEDQERVLRRYGVEFAQGYLFSRPLSAAQLEAYWHRADPGGASIATIVRLYSGGASPTTIAAILNGQGSTAPSGRRWHRQSVIRALTNLPGLQPPPDGD